MPNVLRIWGFEKVSTTDLRIYTSNRIGAWGFEKVLVFIFDFFRSENSTMYSAIGAIHHQLVVE